MTNSQLPFSQAAENNKHPILKVLKGSTTPHKDLLEIGHGNAQHASFMSKELKVNWFPSDIQEHHWIAKKMRELHPNEFLKEPLILEAGEKPLCQQVLRQFDYIYTANTLHIMSEKDALILCREISTLLRKDGLLFIYGPFKFQGTYTSESNKNFNDWLKDRDPQSGIRDFELIENELKKSGISFSKRHDLPANNQLLVFIKST